MSGARQRAGPRKAAAAGPAKPAAGPASHGPPPRPSVARLVAVVATVAALDAGVLWWLAETAGAGDAWAEKARAARSVEDALGVLGVEVADRDVVGGDLAGPLTVTRVLSAVVTLIMTAHIYMTNDYPLIRSNYGHIVHIRRWRRFTTFTVWSWTILTIYFTKMALHSLQVLPARSKWAPVLFEVCFSAALTVTLVVHFVLVPMARRKDPYRLSRLMNWRAIIMHYANLCMMLVEATLSGLPMLRRHLIFMVAYANLYVAFALVWHRVTGIFYYFFMDYTRFVWAPLAYVGLTGVLVLVWLVCTTFVERIDEYVRPQLVGAWI